MDMTRFDRLIWFFAKGSTRRGLMQCLAAALSMASAGCVPDLTRAKRRKKKVKHNKFGCVNVGNTCKHDNQCCSGICKGKKGKNRCKAHDTGGCPDGLTEAFCGGTDVVCQTTGGTGTCNTTSGNAPFCTVGGTECALACGKDADCQAVCGPNAACVKCATCASGASCVGPADCF